MLPRIPSVIGSEDTVTEAKVKRIFCNHHFSNIPFGVGVGVGADSMPSFPTIRGSIQFIRWDNIEGTVPLCYGYIAAGVLTQEGVIDKLPRLLTSWQLIDTLVPYNGIERIFRSH